MLIEFGEWLPDLPEFDNQGALVIKNVIPIGESYEEFKSQVIYTISGASASATANISASCQGFFTTRDNDGNEFNFAGDNNKLYRVSSSSFRNVTRGSSSASPSAYTVASGDIWDFTRFQNRVIAAQLGDGLQTFIPGTSARFSNLYAEASATGSATITILAKTVATIKDFLVVGNTNSGAEGHIPYRVRWSGINAPTAWVASATTQSDAQDLPFDNGDVQRIISGNYGIIFQERAITRMTYVGSPLVFQFDEMESGRGTPSPFSVRKIGDLIFYLGQDGFYVFDGEKSTAIGANKIDRTFWNDVDKTYLNSIVTAVDFNKHVIYWAYAGDANTRGRRNRILCFNYASNSKKRWSIIEDIDIEFLNNFLTEGYTLDTLDTVSTNIDTLLFSLDSRVWVGGLQVLSGFDTSHRLVNFTGDALNATLETGLFQIYPDNRANLTLLRPMIDRTSTGSLSLSLQVGIKDNLYQGTTYKPIVNVNSTGNCPVRANARYHRVRANISGGFGHAIGVEVVKSSKEGMR